LPQAEALYTDLSDEPDPVPLEMLSHLIQLGQRVVLIVDNCGVELHRKLAAKVSSSNCVLSVITIEYDINDDEPENTDVFKLEPASESLIEKMLEKRYPGIASPSLRVIAQFSAGNARVAFALAETAKNGASLANLRDSKLFRRLFEQAKGSSDALFDAAKVCALLYSFDGETLDGTDSELAPLAKIAGISVDELHKHVAELQRRQLVQRRGKWRAILPHALAHRLAGRALEDIPFARIEHGIIKGSSARMLRSFSRRVGYLHDDDRALAITAAWLADGGLLAPIGTLNELGETILENIAPVDPAATLAYFERAASRDASFFDPTNRNKKKILRIIRSLAYDAVLFERCVELLKRFVLAENADTHDSALDALKSLFQIYLSGSHATPLQRASFVTALLEDRRSEKLGLTLLQVMLECGPFTSHSSFEFGARKRDYGLHPNRGAEIKEWYVRALEVARIIGSAPTATAAAVRRHLAGRIPDMLTRTGAVDEVIAICTGFAATSGWPEGWIGIRGALRRGKDRIPLPVREQLEQLESQLRPQGLPAMIRSYALSPEWGALDIAEFEEDEEQRPFEARQRVNELCEEMGQQIANDPDQLRALLPEILVAEAQKTFMLGRGIAVACTSLAECWAIVRDAFLEVLEPQRKLQVLGGFLSAAMRRSPVETESFLDEILSDPRFHTYFMWLQTCAGVTGVSFARMNQALDLATVPIDSFVHLAGGRAHEGLDDEQLGALAARVAEKEGGFPVAAQILGMRVFGRTSDKLPVGEPIKAAGRKFLETAQFVRGSSRLDYLLGEIAEVSFTGPEHEEQVRRLCIRVLQGIRSYQVYASDVADLLKAITKTFPVVVLDVFVEQGDVEDDMRQTIFQEMREHRTSPLEDVPEDIWRAWAEEAPSTRYACLASVVKFSVGSDDAAAKEWSETAKKLINAAPHVESVLDTFFARFEPMSWSGSRADIIGSRLPLLESLRLHPRAEVAAWANARIPVLSAAVERERGNEARDSRLRDEAFE
jgi:hypothetical protein